MIATSATSQTNQEKKNTQNSGARLIEEKKMEL